MNSNTHMLPTSIIATEIVLPGTVEPSELVVRERALPALRPGETLLQMEATGISFAEQAMRRGLYPGQPAFPFVPGYDLVGRIVAVGGKAYQVRAFTPEWPL